MIGVFRRMIENLTHGTKQCSTIDAASTQIGYCVKTTPIVFVRKQLLRCVVLGVNSRWCGEGKLSRRTWRIVCTSVGPYDSEIANCARYALVGILPDRVWLYTKASAMVCTLRVRCNTVIFTLFQVLIIRMYIFILYVGWR